MAMDQERLATVKGILKVYFGEQYSIDLELADADVPEYTGTPFMIRGFYCGIVEDPHGRPIINLLIDREGNLIRVRSAQELDAFFKNFSSCPRSQKWVCLQQVTEALRQTMSRIEWIWSTAFGKGPRLVGEQVHWRDSAWKIVNGNLYVCNPQGDSLGWYRFLGW